MRLSERLHVLHRAWRYRLRTERDEIAFLLSQDLRGATVVDIGANRGAYTYWMHRQVGTQGSVIAFEPQPELARFLADLKSSFHLRQLTIVPAGLSSQAGPRTLVRPRRHWGGGGLDKAPSADTEGVSVSITTLDEYFRNCGDCRPPLRFIKCDVEGHEEPVFRGAEAVLRDSRPVLLFEHPDRFVRVGSLFAYLDDLGYDGFFFFERRLQPLRTLKKLRSRIAKPTLNYVFRPRAQAVRLAA